MPEKVKTRFLLLSDTHALAPNPPATTSLPCRWPLPFADVAIHTGDLTLNGKLSEHTQAVNLLKKLRAELKIAIPGNHDLTLDTPYYAENGGIHGPWPKYDTTQLQQIRDLYTGPEAQQANIVYLEEGTRTFQLKNGASLTVYASAYTPEFCNWAFAYERDQDRFNPPNAENPVPSFVTDSKAVANIDVILTHGPPLGILDSVKNWATGGSTMHVGCEHLGRAVGRARPLLHCFGHIHEGWGAVRKTWSREPQSSSEEASAGCTAIAVDSAKMVEDMGAYINGVDLQAGEETLFVNASIVDLRYKPVQGPWIVDLMLDKHG